MNVFKSAVLCLLVLALMPSLGFTADPDYDPFYSKGVSLDGGPPINGIEEGVDPFSGNLKIVQTDLELPQNGGLDLKIMRFYDSAIWSRWSVSAGSLPVALNRKSPLGIGWSMHMGIMRNAGGSNPEFEMPDGSRHAFYFDKNDLNRMISDDDWVYKRVSTSGFAPFLYELTAPDGTVYTLEYGGVNAGYYEFNTNGEVAQVVKIQNPSRTSTITIDYEIVTDPFLTPYSYLKTITDSVGRVITFNYNQSLHQLSSISVDSRTYNYYYNTFVGNNSWRYNTLIEVKPPVGNSWKYNYETDNYGLKKLTYSTGGEINYSYAPVTFPTGGALVSFRVISQRSTSGRDIPAGTWTYQYAPGGNSGIGTAGAVTTVTAPNGRKEVYKYYSWDNYISGLDWNIWRVGRLIDRKLYQDSSLIETDAYTWAQGTQISNTLLKSANWGNGVVIVGGPISIPLLTSKTITRDGQTYTTTYSNHDAYGNPRTVVESSDKTRTTVLTYWTNPSLNIVRGKLASETVSGGFAGSFTTSYGYDTYGKLTLLNKFGVITGYSYFSNGNLQKITDANNRNWTYDWSNGQIKSITNPVYTINRIINANGTIASETNGRGYITSYLYDSNLRLTKVTPPVGNPINFIYPVDSSYRKKTRGSYYLYEYYDGFGRPTGTLDSKGVTANIDYNTDGSKNFADSNVGDKADFDVFDRVDFLTHKDNTTINYSYSGSNVTATDEASKTTTMTYNAFGNPDEKLLVAVKDALNNTASYDYNILGSLTSISFGGVSRTFGYSSKNFLTSEINPENGTITYYRDNVGTLSSKTEVTGTTSYGYDNLYRLTSVTSGSNSLSFGYDNADNRTSSVSPSANQSFTFDATNRVTQKTEIISGSSDSTVFVYDANDNRTSITYPSNRSISYSYNGNNEVTAVPGYVTTASYNLAGQPLSYAYANGITNTLTYNTRYLPTGISAGLVLNKGYGYDTRGNTTAITDGLNSSKNQTLTYDNLSRITGFNGAWGNGSFTYDVSGNRQSKAVTGAANTTYSYTNNRLTSFSGGESGSFVYDGTGRVSSGIWSGQSYNLTYDNFNNVKTFASGANVISEQGYDGDGLRVIKTVDGKTAISHYDITGNVISENYSNGEHIADYIYLNGKLIATVRPDRDRTPPSLSIDNSIISTQSSSQNLSGTREAGATISVTGNTSATIGAVTYPTTTSWSCPVSALVEGNNVFTFVAKDAALNATTMTATVVRDTMAPTLTLTAPPALTNVPNVTLSGTKEAGAVIITVRRNTSGTLEMVTYPTTTSWSCFVSNLVQGDNVFTVEAMDLALNTTTQTATINFDITPPVVSLNALFSPTNSSTLSLSGTREAGAVITITSNTTATPGTVTYPTSTSWSCPVSNLAVGNNVFGIQAKDAALNTTTLTTTVELDIVPPAVSLNVMPSPTNSSTLTLTGTMEAGAIVMVGNYRATVGTVTYPTATTWSCPVSNLLEGDNLFEIFAVDDASNISYAEENIILDTIAPALYLTAPPALTTVSTVVLSGTMEANAIISITANPAATIDAVTYPTTTSWSCVVSGLAEGANAFAVTATDAAGNNTVTSIGTVLDSVAEVAINAPASPTNVNNQILSGTREAGATLGVNVNTAASVGTVSYPTATSWSCVVSGLVEGTNTFNVSAIDALGNNNAKSVNIVLDTVAEVSFNAPISPTNVISQTLGGTREAGAVVAVSADTAAAVGQVSYPTATSWSCAVSGLVEGPNSFTVTVTDVAGNNAITAATLTFDSVLPTVTVNAPVSPTNINSQTLSGTRESGATVAVSVDTAATVGTVSYPTATSWSCLVSGLAERVNTFTIAATDNAGNSVAATAAVTLDTIAEVSFNAPTSPTNVNSQTLSGTMEAGAVVVLAVDTTAATVGPVSYPTATSWSCAVSGMAEGTNTFTATVTDAIGNVGIQGTVVVLDTVAPAMSVNPATSPTKVSSQMLSGTREAGAAVVVSADTAAVIGPVSYPTATSWSCTVSSLVEGTNTFNVTVTDAAGNVGIQGIIVLLDTVAPAVSINPATSPTNINSQTLSGTMEEGAAVVVAVDTTATVGPVSYLSTTSWSCTVSGLIEGENIFTVTATDAVGNVAAETVSIKRDTIPPVVTINPPVSPTPSLTLALGGSRESGATISISISTSSSVVSVNYPSPTSWACTLDLQYGDNTIIVTASDALGNSTTATTTVMRYRVPVDFMAIPATGGVPFVVTFTNLSQSALSWLWNFGDGSTSIERNPAPHVYRSAGSYTVTLTTSDGSHTNTLQKTNFILATACQNSPFRIESSTPLYFTSLWDARTAALDGETIQMLDQTVILPEVITLDRDITLDGGFDCGFTTKTGETVLKGDMEITGGTTIINDAIIDKQ